MIWYAATMSMKLKNEETGNTEQLMKFLKEPVLIQQVERRGTC